MLTMSSFLLPSFSIHLKWFLFFLCKSKVLDLNHIGSRKRFELVLNDRLRSIREMWKVVLLVVVVVANCKLLASHMELMFTYKQTNAHAHSTQIDSTWIEFKWNRLIFKFLTKKPLKLTNVLRFCTHLNEERNTNTRIPSHRRIINIQCYADNKPRLSCCLSMMIWRSNTSHATHNGQWTQNGCELLLSIMAFNFQQCSNITLRNIFDKHQLQVIEYWIYTYIYRLSINRRESMRPDVSFFIGSPFSFSLSVLPFWLCNI